MKKVLLLSFFITLFIGLNFPQIATKSKTKPQLVNRKSQVKLAKRVSVLSPSGGKYVTGQNLYIRWKTNYKTGPKDYFILELYNGSGKRFKRLIKRPGTPWGGGGPKIYGNRFPWKIPDDIWPEFYTIRVTHSGSDAPVTKVASIGATNVAQKRPSGFSARFHIARSYGQIKTYTLKPGIVNKEKISAHHFSKRYCQVKREKMAFHSSPMKGKIRVGFASYRGKDSAGDSGKCFYYYRSRVGFSLRSIPKGSIILEARLKYARDSGCGSKPTIFVIEEKWNKNSDLWSIKTSSPVNPKNLKDVVTRWMAFPNANYGLLFSGPGKYPGKSACLIHCYWVSLTVKARVRSK